MSHPLQGNKKDRKQARQQRRRVSVSKCKHRKHKM